MSASKANRLEQMKGRHQQQIKGVRAAYELQIKQLVNDQKARVKGLKGDLTQQKQQRQAQIDALTQDLNQKLADMERKFSQEAAKAQEAEDRADKLDGQNQKLVSTKMELQEIKQQLEARVQELKGALVQSQDKLQTLYDTIQRLRDERDRMQEAMESAGQEEQAAKDKLKVCNQKRKQLDQQINDMEIGVATYQREMREVREKELALNEEVQRIREGQDQDSTQLRQCQGSIADVQRSMEAEKQRHLSLRADFQDQVDRLKALTEALDKCKKSNADAQQIVAEMQERYDKLRAKSEQTEQKYREMVRQRDQYVQELEEEKKRTEQWASTVKDDRQELEARLAKVRAEQKRTYGLLETCQEKGGACAKQSVEMGQYLDKLEGEIKRLTKALRSEKKISARAAQLDEQARLSGRDLNELKQQFKDIQMQNDELKQLVADFEGHKKFDQDRQAAHRQLKEKHAQAMAWIKDMGKKHKRLHLQQDQSLATLEEMKRRMQVGQAQLERAAAEKARIEQAAVELKKQADACPYPGQLAVLNEQINDLLKEREQVRARMGDKMADQEMLMGKLKKVQKENEDLRILQDRYKMDAAQMERIVQQGAELNVELLKSKKLLTKKDRQLELLSGQLAALMHQFEKLKVREQKLNGQVQTLVAPEEVVGVQEKLNQCRLERKKGMARFEAMKMAADRMAEQLKVNEAKVRSLVDILRTSENAQVELKTERKRAQEFEEAIKRCGEARNVDRKELMTKVQAASEMYETNLVKHTKQMEAAKERIQQLEAELAKSQRAKAEHDDRMADARRGLVDQRARMEAELAALKAGQAGRKGAGPMTQDQAIKQVRQDLTVLNKKASQMGTDAKVAVQAANLDSVKQLASAQAQVQAQMRAKEEQIMRARDQTYQQVLQTLNRSSNQDEMVSERIQKIRAEGAAREQRAMSDMIQLREAAAKLGNQSRQASTEQWRLLDRANVEQRNRIMSLMDDKERLERELRNYQSVVGAQKSYVQQQRAGVISQLRDQGAYINDLERTLPRMRAIEEKMRLAKFPDVGALQQQIGLERSNTLSALDRERAEAKGHIRSRSAREDQLAAQDQSVRGMYDLVQRYIREPTTSNKDMLGRFVQKSPDQLQRERQQAKLMSSNAPVQMHFVAQQRHPSQGPPNTALALDRFTGEMQIRPGGQSNRFGPNRYFADSVGIFSDPRTTFAPTVQRAGRQLQRGADLVAVVYSFFQSNLPDIRYRMFQHAIIELMPKIQSLSPTGSIDVQLVRTYRGGGRQDLLMTSQRLQQNCTYQQCRASIREVNNVRVAADLMNNLNQAAGWNKMPDGNDVHTIMTLQAHGVPNGPRIHVADVLFMSRQAGQPAVPPPQSMQLVDGSWIGYLAEVIQKPSTKIDFFFSPVPHAANDQLASVSNDNLLRVSRQIQQFLARLKRNPSALALS